MFIIDFLSSVPYRYLTFLPKQLSIFKILKITRISRFGPFVQKLELNEEDKAVSDYPILTVTAYFSLDSL